MINLERVNKREQRLQAAVVKPPIEERTFKAHTMDNIRVREMCDEMLMLEHPQVYTLDSKYIHLQLLHLPQHIACIHTYMHACTYMHVCSLWSTCSGEATLVWRWIHPSGAE